MKTSSIRFFTFILVFFLFSCSDPERLKKSAQKFLDAYTKKYTELAYKAQETDWKSNTMIIEGDTNNSTQNRIAKEALANFTGSTENINQSRRFLRGKDSLTELQVKQFERILYAAANQPQIAPELVKERIKVETEETEKLYGFTFKIGDSAVTPNKIDKILHSENDTAKRLAAWISCKEVGKVMKPGLMKLRDLRNQTVQKLGYADYFSYQASDYGMTTEELIGLMRQINKELYPLFRELHTYARYYLAEKYKSKKVPDLLPAHWLPNRWGQDWSAFADVKGFDLDTILQKKDDIWMVKQGESFYKSLGYDALPKTFWDKSSLYAFPENLGFKKNTHASAWHVDLDKDVRSLMSVIPNADWYETIHHELGHIYYFMSYSNPEVPVLLREGANRAYHEAMGSMIGFAAMQSPFLVAINLLPSDTKIDTLGTLLKEALNYVIFIPWSSGVMTEFEYELYAKNLPSDQFNKKWWELVAKYQGIAPPSFRGEEYCDAATKTHIIDDPAQYYDYGISFLLLFQFHDYIAKNILKQDPHFTNYYGNKETGEYLRSIMKPGLTADWRKMMKEKTGSELNAKPMLDYFAPLVPFLKNINKGRKCTLPEESQIIN
ncbi:MAG: peptidase [Bacteroidetes bacterium RIFCSPLOWO2_12_FULL_37_12]|nr:MAG: peptidase [Bacteroidetes bacterium RIFCSPLOWO2_12_FULL_37_12]